MSTREGSRWHRLRFFVEDAWDEMRHSPGVNLLAVLTLVAALFLAGLGLLFIENVRGRVNDLRADVRVAVYLLDEVDDETREGLIREATEREGVRRVEYIDRMQALERYRKWAGADLRLLDELDSNPLPESLELHLVPGEDAELRGIAVADSFRGREGVEDVRFDRGLVRRLEGVLDIARLGGTAVSMVVLGAVVFVMASVLRLAVYARRDEIQIMQLVGATPGFVRGPFMVAGVAQGIVSALLACVLVEIARRGVFFYVNSETRVLVDLVAARPLPVVSVGILLACGLLVSCTSAWFAVRRSF